MFNQILPFLLIYFFIIFSILGYGSTLIRILENKITLININIGFIGLIGVFFFILYSYLTSYFLPHNQLHNFLLIFSGIILFSINFKTFKKKDINFLILFFLIIFISFITFKNHDDFTYYHFSYTYNLTQFSHLIGLGNFNHGFKTPSSIFYLNSLFYLPYFKYNLFNLGSTLILGFSIIILSNNLLNFKKKYLDATLFLNLFSFIFIIIFFYRISEHGTDRSAQILILLFFIEILNLKNNYNYFRLSLIKITTLISLVISLKSFYILYLIFGLIILYQLHVDKKKDLIFETFKSAYFFMFLSMLYFIFFSSFLSTGCIIFPISQTCFENYDWSLPLETVNYLNDWYEQWSKGGASPNYRVDDPEIYIERYNWVDQWFKSYFFTKISDLLGGLFLLTIIIFFTFKNNMKLKKPEFTKLDILLFCCLLILFFEWFYNHPALRYGGYVLFVLLICYPFSIFLARYKLKMILTKKKIKILILISCFIFILRNGDRLINEYEKYGYNPLKDITYNISKNDLREYDRINVVINKYNNCLLNNSLKSCFDKNEIKVKRYGNNYIFYK